LILKGLIEVTEGNNFGDKEAASIAEGLKHNVVLTILDLSHNQIGDLGGLALGNVTFADIKESCGEQWIVGARYRLE
jgi:Leucine Rich repeat